MVIELKTTVNSEEVEKYLKQLPETSFTQARKVFARAVLAADTEIKQNATDRIKVRSGRLRRSIQNEVTGMDLASLRASVFSGGTGASKPVVYAPIHEFGGTVQAKNAYLKVPGGPYLNVPILSNLTKAGVPRLTAQMVFSKGGYIRKSKKGRWIVFLGDKPMFALIKSVTIDPNLGMRKAADNQIDNVLKGLSDIIGEG